MSFNDQHKNLQQFKESISQKNTEGILEKLEKGRTEHLAEKELGSRKHRPKA